MAYTWTKHSRERAQRRFPGMTLQELEELIPGARRPGKKVRGRLKELCPLAYEKYMAGRIFRGRYVVITRDDIVFVLKPDDTIITVFQLGVTDAPLTAPMANA